MEIEERHASTLKDSWPIEDSWYELIERPHLMRRLGEAFQAALNNASMVVDSWTLKRLESNETINTIEATLKRQSPALTGKDAETLQ